MPAVARGGAAAPGTLLSLGEPAYGLADALRLLEAGIGDVRPALRALLGPTPGARTGAGDRSVAAEGDVHAYPPSSQHPPNAVPPYPAPPPPDVYGRRPLVALYSTDSTEAYPTRAGIASPAFSRDQALSVVQVGAVLAQALYRLGVDSVHSRAVNDPDGMIGAYENSQRTAAALVADYPSVRILLDVHRATAGEGPDTAAPAPDGVAAVALVVGTDDRLPDPRWRQNLAFAHVLAAAAERLYPGWPVRVAVSANQYNQELSTGALLVQVGGPRTPLAAADRAALRLARVIAAVVRAGLYPGAPR